jgi:hypothetical protein
VSEILDKWLESDEYEDASVPTLAFKELLGELDLPREVKAMLSCFFVMGPNRRPTAEKLLQSEE